MKTALGRLAAFVLVFFFMGVMAAFGNHTVRWDKDDSKGQFDIHKVDHGHAGGGVLTHTIKTFEGWDKALLRNHASEWIFDLKVGQRILKVRVDVIDSDGSLFAEVTEDGTIIGYAKVWKPDAKSLRIQFPKRFLGEGIDSYRWFVQSTFNHSGDENCGDSHGAILLCVDRAPNFGRIFHQL